MNYAVDGQHRDAKEVVHEFLKKQGTRALSLMSGSPQITSVPRSVSTAWPLRMTRAPAISHQSSPPRSDNCRACNCDFAEAIRPVGRESAVGRAGHRIFRHAVAGLEVARHEIDVLPGRGDRHNRGMELFQAREIGAQVLDCAFVVVHHKVGFVHFENVGWTRSWPESVDQLVRRTFAGLREKRGEVHREEIAVPADGESSAMARLKPHRVEPWFEQVEHHIRGSQGRMAAKSAPRREGVNHRSS